MRKLTDKTLDKIVQESKKGELMVAQIGVWTAEDSKAILDKMNVNIIYLIEPYMPARDYKDGMIEGIQITPEHTVEKILEEAEDEARQKLSVHPSKTLWLRMLSSRAKEYVTNNLDFVFILRNHKYENIIEELKGFYPKLAKGGIISGHNYQDQHVNRAVNDFAEREFVTYNVIDRNWWIKKC